MSEYFWPAGLSGGGSGDVVGPASSTDNALARFDGTTGKLLQNSVAILTDSGNLSGIANLTVTGTTTLNTGLSGVLVATAGVVSASSAGNLTSTPTTNLVVTGGTGAVIGSGVLLTLTGASLVEATSSVLTITGAANAVLGTGVSIQVKQSNTTTSGYLSSTDWNTFNGKQASGNYITALTGDGTASGPGSAALTLATVNANVGSFGSATQVAGFTVNAKGLVTAAANTSIQIAESQVTNLVSDLAGKQPTGNYITALTGEVTASGPGSVAATVSNAAVIAKVLTGYSSGAGTVSAADSILQAIQKLNGNITANQPMTTLGDTIYGGASGVPTRLAGSTVASRQFLTQTGTGSLSASPQWLTPIAPTVQIFTATGAGTYNRSYVFTVTSANATVGATYTNNSITYTVSKTIASATALIATGSNIPLASGTLTKASGTGDATITFSSYVTPIAIRVRAVGPGGGGGGSGTGSATSGAGGVSNTTFSSFITANTGTGGQAAVGVGGAAGQGGSFTISSPAIGNGYIGNSGSAAFGSSQPSGPAGGSALFGGGAPGSAVNVVGLSGSANSGGGGSGAGGNTGNSGGSGGGGGSVDAIIWGPSATYSLNVGPGGLKGNAGTAGLNGGNAADGQIEVTEYYQ